MASLNRDEFLTAEEACALLGVKPATLYAYVSRGVLQSYREGIRRRRLYRRDDVERLLTVRPSTSGESARVEPAHHGDRVEQVDHARGADAVAPSTSLPRAEDWIPFVN